MAWKGIVEQTIRYFYTFYDELRRGANPYEFQGPIYIAESSRGPEPGDMLEVRPRDDAEAPLVVRLRSLQAVGDPIYRFTAVPGESW